MLVYNCFINSLLVPQDLANRGVWTSNNELVDTACLFETNKSTLLSELHYAECIHKKAVFVGFLHDVWGHIFTDCFKKLWYLHTEEGKHLLDDENVDFIYITENNKSLNHCVNDFLSLLDLRLERFTHITEATRYDEIIVPEDCFYGRDLSYRIYTDEYLSLIEYIRAKVSQMPIDKNLFKDRVYFSERHFVEKEKNKTSLWGFPKSQGEWEIERVFQKKGYHVLFPDTLSVAEQIAIVMNCSYFASTEGSISHTTVFCNPGTDVVFVKKMDWINPYQMAINEAAKLKVTFLNANCSQPQGCTERFWAGPFYLCITKELESFAGHKIWHWPYCLRPSWLWYKNYNRKFVHRLFKLFHIDFDFYKLR